MVDGLPNIEKTKGRCMTCLAGKKHKEFIDMGTSIALGIVHVELCNLTRLPSLLGVRYCFLAVNDFSQRLCVFFFKQEIDALNPFYKI
jgi:hypothetical protein